MRERSDSKELRRKAEATVRMLVEQSSPMSTASAALCMDVGVEAYLRGAEDATPLASVASPAWMTEAELPE